MKKEKKVIEDFKSGVEQFSGDKSKEEEKEPNMTPDESNKVMNLPKEAEKAKKIATKSIEAIEEITKQGTEKYREIHDKIIEEIAQQLEKHGISKASPFGVFLLELYKGFLDIYTNNIKLFISTTFENYRNNISMFFDVLEKVLTDSISINQDIYKKGDEIIQLFGDAIQQWLSISINSAKQVSLSIQKNMEITADIFHQYNNAIERQFQLAKDVQENTFKLIEQWISWWR